jgi:hypothetical protein
MASTPTSIKHGFNRSVLKMAFYVCAGCLAVTVTEAYLSAAEYVGAECKYTEVYGIDTNLNLGGGAQKFTFRRSAQVRLLPQCGGNN